MSKGTAKQAAELLDRFFRDAEGRTNRQLDVYFTLEDMKLSRDKAEPAMDFLVSRGLINAFGPDIAFLTDRGVEAVSNEYDLENLPRMTRDFEQVAVNHQDPSEPGQAPTRAEAVEPQIVHIGLDGNEFVVKLGWKCTVGRADQNDITVEDKRASKHHAEIRYEDGGYVLHDLESANGTLLNGEYVVEPTTLKHDDEVVIGRTMLLFQSPYPVPTPEGPAPTHASVPPSEDLNLPATERPRSADLPEPMPVIMGTPDLPMPGAGASEALDGPEMSKLGRSEDGARSLRDPDAFSDADLPQALPSEPQLAEPPAPFEVFGESMQDVPRPPGLVEADPEAPPEEELHPEPEYLDPTDLQPLGSSDDASQLPTEDPELQQATEDADLDGSSQDTIMTSREALFGAFARSDLEPEPETLPPGWMAPVSEEGVDAEALTPRPELHPSGLQTVTSPEEAPPRFPPDGGFPSGPTPTPTDAGTEPALLVLLEAVRQRLLLTSSVPDRQELLAAVELLQEHPSLQALAASIEKEFGDSDPA